MSPYLYYTNPLNGNLTGVHLSLLHQPLNGNLAGVHLSLLNQPLQGNLTGVHLSLLNQPLQVNLTGVHLSLLLYTNPYAEPTKVPLSPNPNVKPTLIHNISQPLY